MIKRNRRIYWIATIWLSLGMVSTGLVQLLKMEAVVTVIKHLGYPVYFFTILAVWKFSGVVVLLVPKFTLLKEWAYAGFFFVMFGAIISHLVMGDAAQTIFPSVLFLTLTVVSSYFRPSDRRINLAFHK